MPPTGNVEEVLFGPGTLYAAPISQADPGTTSDPAATVSAAILAASAWREVGWTDDGSTIDIAYKNEGIKVEEEFYAVKYATTDVEMMVGFNMKQASRRNLALALNVAANAANDGTAIEPPAPGAEVRVKLALITPEGAVWLFRRCFQGGSVKIDRKKAPNVALLPVQFRLEKPQADEPWALWPTSTGQI